MARGNLQPAHKGYRFQDIVTAYVLLESIIRRDRSVTVDKKTVDGDKFDDIEVVTGEEYRVCRQFKHSEDESRCITLEDFTATGSSLRIDKLVRTYKLKVNTPVHEFWLCVTWKTPEDPTLRQFLEPISCPGSFIGCPTKLFKFRGEAIWPIGSGPRWPNLKETGDDVVSRDDFLAFTARFIIETELPRASMSLLLPGPLEQALLDLNSNRIGIGRYPNQGRTSSDVTALAISLANLARTKGATLSPDEVEAQLGIRTDYGRVAQTFPIDPSTFLDRPDFRKSIFLGALEGTNQIVTGPPGAGKSWALTRLADDLQAAGVLVARHYCFLEPGDELVERRITTNAFFGNLMADITDADPSLRGELKRRYSADLDGLEALLRAAAGKGHPVVLIVDGLDHIARVRAYSRKVSDLETDIVEQLATINLPANVAVIFGSQPGAHLDILRESFGPAVVDVPLPPWPQADIHHLARKLGVTNALERVGEEDHESVLTLLGDRSEGNPLYATYLAKELISRIESSTIADAKEWLAEAPEIAGNVATYYAYLYGHASDTAKAIADVLGVIDFGVSESDLLEMLPAPIRAWVPEALRVLSPILTATSSQGGFRIFHESFRRFMTEELARRGRSVGDAMESVIVWLERRGFYRDAKAYRFLLPALRRAGRSDEIFALVGIPFVSESLVYGHPETAVHRNLSIALDAAAQARRWPEVVRYIELHRSMCTCFAERMQDPLPYWRTFLDLHGPDVLVERLLFDGQPTHSAGLGLILCSMADDAGATPPWSEYLDLPEELDEGRPTGYSEQERLWDKNVSIARVHGAIRVDGPKDICSRILAWLRRNGDDIDYGYARDIADRVAKSAGLSALRALIVQGTECIAVGDRIPPKTRVLLQLVLARNLTDSGEAPVAEDLVTGILDGSKSMKHAIECLGMGVPALKCAALAKAPSSFKLGIGPGEHSPDAPAVNAWVSSIRLLAGVDEIALEKEMARIAGEGWYRCWLRYIISLARIDAERRAGNQAVSAVSAFAELSRDARPFVGKPRACDLYQIHGTVAESLEWGLAFLRTPDEWSEALGHLRTAINGTVTLLDRGASGPITPEVAMKALLPYAARPDIGPLILAFAEEEVTDSDESGTYFEVHADHAMLFARILNAYGEKEKADEHWRRAAHFLVGYGFRKDVTIYEILESAPALRAAGRDAAFAALVASQPMAETIYLHTDGRETKHAPNSWFRSLISLDMPASLALLARSMNGRGGADGWYIERGIEDVLRKAKDIGDPILLGSLHKTLPLESSSEEESIDDVKKELEAISRLMARDRQLGEEFLHEMAAKVACEGRRFTQGPLSVVHDFAASHGIGNVQPPPDTTKTVKDRAVRSRGVKWTGITEGILGNLFFPYFSCSDKGADLVRGIREMDGKQYRSGERPSQSPVNSLGYRLVELLQSRGEEDAIRILRFFARSYHFLPSDRNALHPLAEVAEGLERHGHLRTAAVAYALAYTVSRGGGGWYKFGDEQHEPILIRGISLDRAAALDTVAGEIVHMLSGTSGNYGITRNLIERIAAWGESDTAKQCWWSAHDVIAYRIPSSTGGMDWFERFDPTRIPDWSVDEGLVAVLLGMLNHPLLSQKISALSGIRRAVTFLPGTVANPLREFLCTDTPLSSIILALEILLHAEESPFPISEDIADLLSAYARCEAWGPRIQARLLLERIGRPIPSFSPEITSSSSMLSPASLKEVIARGGEERIKRLARICPDIPNVVSHRFHSIRGLLEVNKREIIRRLRLEWGDDGESRPATPVLGWDTELFETALHEALNGVGIRLWSTGDWSPEAEASIRPIVVPSTRIHLGLHSSRVPRPSWPNPEDFSPGLMDVPVCDDREERFADWYRVAYVERHWIRSPKESYQPPKSLVTVFAGAVAVPLGEMVPQDAFPFRECSLSEWWPNEDGMRRFQRYPFAGPIVGLSHIDDWLGNAHILTPPKELLATIRISPPAFGSPLEWRDADGRPVVVLRTWQIRNHEALKSKPAEFLGTDLLVRPDLFSRIKMLRGCPIMEWSLKHSENI